MGVPAGHAQAHPRDAGRARQPDGAGGGHEGPARVTARIVLFGATGYTGARTAEALVARGARPVLAGRDPARLGRLADRLGGLETVRADVTDPRSVRGLLGHGDVLVTTVGPFLRLGQAAVDAAVAAGAVYLDSTGEPPFVRRLFEQDGRPRGRHRRGADPGVRAGLRARQPRRGAGADRGGRAGAPRSTSATPWTAPRGRRSPAARWSR